MIARLALVFTTLALLLAACGGDSSGTPSATPTAGEATDATATPGGAPSPTVAIPAIEPSTDIDLPPGFTAYIIAGDLGLPTSVALSPEGAIYVSQYAGIILRLEDADGDGVFDRKVEFASELYFANGADFAPDGSLYVSSQGRVSIVRDTDGDTVGDQTEAIITGLPIGVHQNNGLAFGPDGKLYLTNGSTCNDCIEEDELSATILQANSDGSDLRVYARGLRNSYDLTFDSQGRLWATDNGSDPPCNTTDEINLIGESGDYGWPYRAACDNFQSGIPPIASLGFNTGSTGVDNYDGDQFPAEYRGDLFITLWGSNALAPRPGGKLLVRALINEMPEGPQVTIEEFGAGFTNPIDVVVDRDGTLLVLDFGGTLYRIVYTGDGATRPVD